MKTTRVIEIVAEAIRATDVDADFSSMSIETNGATGGLDLVILVDKAKFEDALCNFVTYNVAIDAWGNIASITKQEE